MFEVPEKVKPAPEVTKAKIPIDVENRLISLVPNLKKPQQGEIWTVALRDIPNGLGEELFKLGGPKSESWLRFGVKLKDGRTYRIDILPAGLQPQLVIFEAEIIPKAKTVTEPVTKKVTPVTQEIWEGMTVPVRRKALKAVGLDSKLSSKEWFVLSMGERSFLSQIKRIIPKGKAPVTEEVTIPGPTRPITEAEKPVVAEYYRREAAKWREIALKATDEMTKEGEQKYAYAILKAEEFERKVAELTAIPKVTQGTGMPEAVEKPLAERTPLEMTSAEFNMQYPCLKDWPVEKQQALLDMLNVANLEEAGVEEPLDLATFQKDFANIRFVFETGGMWIEEHKQMIEGAVKRGEIITPKVREEYEELIASIEAKRAKAGVLREKRRQARIKERQARMNERRTRTGGVLRVPVLEVPVLEVPVEEVARISGTVPIQHKAYFYRVKSGRMVFVKAHVEHGTKTNMELGTLR